MRRTGGTEARSNIESEWTDMIKVEKLQIALQQLSRAIDNHEQWYRALIRTITCRLPYDRRDVSEDAHRKCNFGQWYYGGEIPQELHGHPAFIALEAKHERMHRLAARLLLASEKAPSIPAGDYDNFAKALDLLQLELQTLRREIENWFHGHDPLTGAENRTSMLTRLRETLELGKRNIGPNCISMMDLDHFKNLNDTYGHLIGDQVLAASAHYVMDHLRPYDRVFRYGGEEFLILMPGAGLQAGELVVDRIRNGLAAAVLAHDGGKPVSITASFGIALLDPAIGLEESMDRADKAMYAAKTAGRNRVCVWGPSIVHKPMS